MFVPRKLGRHVHKLNAVHDTFIRVAQEGAEADGYSQDLMELLQHWSMEGTYVRTYVQELLCECYHISSWNCQSLFSVLCCTIELHEMKVACKGY